MTTKKTKKGTRSLALAIAFAVALSLFGGILFAPEAYADTTTVTWDSSVLSTFDEGDTEQSSQGITFNRPDSAYISQSQLYVKGYTSFSSNIGKIKKIVISKSDMGYYSLERDYDWKYENNTFTWSGTPIENVTFSYSGEGVIPLDSIVFTIENPHEHNSLVKTDKVEPTCDQDGHEAYWTCTVCNKMFSDAEGKNQISSPIIIPTKHTLVKTDKVEPTCYQDGHEAYWTCSECFRMFSDSEGKNEISNPITLPAKHSLVKIDKVEPTCFTEGREAYWKCTVCNVMFLDSEGKHETFEFVSIPQKKHDWREWTVLSESTLFKNGIETCNCKNCGLEAIRIIPKKTPNLSKNALLLNSALKLTQTGSKLNLKFGKVSDATSYEVFISYYGQKKAQVFKTTKNSLTIKKLNGKNLNTKKVFKVQVVAKAGSIKLGQSMNAYVAGKNAKFTNVKTVKLTAKSISLKVGKTSKIKATTIPENQKKIVLSYEGTYRYLTTNKNVAAVNAKGIVAAKHKGSCYIYVFADNGYAAKIKVTVK